MGPSAPPGEVSAAAREVFRNVSRYYVDLVRMPHTPAEMLLRQRLDINGLEIIRAIQAEGRGVIISTAHFGNPEVAVQVGPAVGLDVLVMSEPLEPPELSELVHRLRASNDARYEPVGYRGISTAIRHLRKGGAVAITCDRDIQDTGATLPFFGAPARVPLGAAELALRTGAAIVPGYCKRRPGGFDIIFEPEVPVASSGDRAADVRETALRLLRRAEAWIRADPGQWIVIERVWDGDCRDGDARMGRSQDTDG
jgi:KDO2-lipid IV(A) lauroyltransferase